MPAGLAELIRSGLATDPAEVAHRPGGLDGRHRRPRRAGLPPDPPPSARRPAPPPVAASSPEGPGGRSRDRPGSSRSAGHPHRSASPTPIWPPPISRDPTGPGRSSVAGRVLIFPEPAKVAGAGQPASPAPSSSSSPSLRPPVTTEEVRRSHQRGLAHHHAGRRLARDHGACCDHDPSEDHGAATDHQRPSATPAPTPSTSAGPAPSTAALRSWRRRRSRPGDMVRGGDPGGLPGRAAGPAPARGLRGPPPAPTTGSSPTSAASRRPGMVPPAWRCSPTPRDRPHHVEREWGRGRGAFTRPTTARPWSRRTRRSRIRQAAPWVS